MTSAMYRPIPRVGARGWPCLSWRSQRSLAVTPRAQAQDAGKIVKAMSDYVAGQKTISLTFDSDIEVVTSELQKIQFTSSGQVLLSRPDKLRATRAGGYADVELVFDGKTVTVLGKHINAFAQTDAPGTIDQLIDRLRDQYNVAMPGADLLLSRVYDELMADVIDAKHIGQGVIDGVECEHLAFRTPDTDWQLWVEIGARPIPRKYVITSKTMAGAPQYTLRIKEWRTDARSPRTRSRSSRRRTPRKSSSRRCARSTRFRPASPTLKRREASNDPDAQELLQPHPGERRRLRRAVRDRQDLADRAGNAGGHRRCAHRPPAHADELCRRGAADGAPRCLCRAPPRRRGRRGLLRQRLLPDGGCLRPRLHAVSVVSGLDIFAWIVLIVLAASTIGVIAIAGALPGMIAKSRGHPWAQAVTVAGWVLLFFGFVFWPLAVIWAYVDVPAAPKQEAPR